MNLAIWQNYHLPDQIIDKGFIPKNSIGPYTQHFENDAIVDIYRNYREIWKNADYIGLLSPRFYFKTGLTSEEVKEFVNKDRGSVPVYLLTPIYYMKSKSPVSKTGYPQVQALAKEVDRNRVFPFDTYLYNSENCINFCNFWIAEPSIFEDYVKNYLIPLMNFLDTDEEVQPILKREIKHRKHETGITYYPQSFFEEALFPIYIHYNKIPYKYIFPKVYPPKRFRRVRNLQLKKRKLLQK